MAGGNMPNGIRAASLEAIGWASEDIEYLLQLVRDGHLVPLEPAVVAKQNRSCITTIVCPDGVITGDQTEHTRRLFGHDQCEGVLTRITPLGGPVMFNPDTILFGDCPEIVRMNVEIELHKIRFMIEHGRCKDICALKPHHVCGACKKYGITFRQVLREETPKAQAFLKKTLGAEYPGLSFPIWPHLQLGKQLSTKGDVEVPNMMRTFWFKQDQLRAAA